MNPAQEFIGHDIVCLHVLDQPLVSQMQKAIRFQQDLQIEAAKNIWYVLRRIKEDDQVRYHLGAGTESYARLTAAYASLTGKDVDAIRDQVLPGSADLHKEQEPS
jgi:hypothetical protein